MAKALGLTRETISGIGLRKHNFPSFAVGDTIAVSFRIIEKVDKEKAKGKDKETKSERLQLFQGDVIAIHNLGASSTFTIRKIGAHGVSVERIVPFHSPMVASIELLKKGDVRRARLYYVRKLVGKAARLKERVLTQAQLDELAAKGVDVEAVAAGHEEVPSEESVE